MKLDEHWLVKAAREAAPNPITPPSVKIAFMAYGALTSFAGPRALYPLKSLSDLAKAAARAEQVLKERGLA